MSDQDKTLREQSGGYYLCDLARTSRDFSIIDVASAQITQLETEEELRRAVDRAYPQARLILTTGKSASGSGDLGLYVLIAVARQEIPRGPWRPVAYVGGAAHGPRCVPFAPALWSDAVDLAGISSSIVARHAELCRANESWRPLTSPHPYREKPDGAEWPIGPCGETCADCGKDPRNAIHKV